MRLRFIYVLFFFLSLTLNESAAIIDNKHKTIDIPLEIRNEKWNIKYVTQIFTGNRDSFKGIPSQLNDKNSIIKYRHFENVLDSIYLIIGDLNEKERICIIDANMNHDFSDDRQYIYVEDTLSKITDFKAQSIKLALIQNGKRIIKNYLFRPDLFNTKNIKYYKDNEIQQKYHAMLALSDWYTGTFRISNNNYGIAIYPRSLTSLSSEYAIFDSSDFNIDSLIRTNRLIQFKTPIIRDKYLFQPLCLAVDNSSITLKYSYADNSNINALTGISEGFYMTRIVKNEINGTNFDSEQLKGKYILIDFWGTWCNPCIALLPHIGELHRAYKDLKIISIAFEMDTKGVDNIQNFINKYQMDWINICDKNFIKESLICSLYEVSSFPTTILIDPNGKIIHRGGSMDIPQLNQKLEKIFK
jgi:thiol-disulfide isomerase/thioredoxin